jgi:hypothetical protein
MLAKKKAPVPNNMETLTAAAEEEMIVIQFAASEDNLHIKRKTTTTITTPTIVPPPPKKRPTSNVCTADKKRKRVEASSSSSASSVVVESLETEEGLDVGNESGETNFEVSDIVELPYPYNIFKAAFIILHTYTSIESIDLTKFKTEISHQFRIPLEDMLAVGDDTLRKIIQDYRVVLIQTERRNISSALLKYSRREAEVLLGLVGAYLRDYSMNLDDVCPGLRTDSEHLKGAKKDLIRNLFDDLPLIFPYRKRDTMKYFIERKLYLSVHNIRGRWSDEDKERLLELYQTHGAKWAKLGRALNKRHEDVRSAYKQMTAKRKGKYSPEEEDRLVDCIRQVTGKMLCPMEELPQLGIAWQHVAKLMGFGRTSIEYQMKWGHLRQRLVFGKVASNINEEDAALHDLLILQAPLTYIYTYSLRFSDSILLV